MQHASNLILPNTVRFCVVHKYEVLHLCLSHSKTRKTDHNQPKNNTILTKLESQKIGNIA